MSEIGRTMHGFGIIGCGMIANFHGKAIQAIPNAELRAVQSRSEANARRVGEAYGAAWTTSLDELLSRDDIGLVTICTPSGAHLEPIEAAARAGKHIIVEKPLEITLDRCDAAIRACEQAGVRLAGVFPSRFHDVSRLIKRTVESGRLGRLTLADATVKWWRSQDYYDKGGWKGTRALDGGGALMNQSIHAIDLLQWMMGPVSKVAAFTDTLAHERIEVEDTAVACLRFASGALGVIEGTTSVFPGFFKKLEISGTKGSIILQEEDLAFWQFDDDSPEDETIRREYGGRTQTGGGASDPAAIGFEAHRKQFAEFLDVLDSGAPLTVDGREARKAVEIILGVYRAAETSSVVSLPLS
ncbi:Gfo/Idh/MocA family oxidoreductase [Candidatus Poribacteria bacterium]|nr:Gfo/Idh/MocA family oxidoreductase [Candidatus Poribacteria bacterium]